MRAYIPYGEFQFEFPEDMKKIIRYLSEHGKVKVREEVLEDLYYQFSDNVYCAQWVSVDDEILAQFAEWLCQIEVAETAGNHRYAVCWRSSIGRAADL